MKARHQEEKKERFVVKHVSVKESRDNMQMKIIKSGYDIISTAKELEQIYLNMSAEEKND